MLQLEILPFGWALAPIMFMFSSGASSSSSSKSGTKFPTKFLNQFGAYFGTGDNFKSGGPTFDPKYVPFQGGQQLEDSLYGSAKSKLTDAYNTTVANQREQLSQSGLLNSPNQFIEGGVRDVTNKGYMSSLEEAARAASQQRLGVDQAEAARATDFGMEKSKALINEYLSLFNSVVGAGKFGKSSGSSSSGFSIG